jgi:hypothetical protein
LFLCMHDQSIGVQPRYHYASHRTMISILLRPIGIMHHYYDDDDDDDDDIHPHLCDADQFGPWQAFV